MVLGYLLTLKHFEDLVCELFITLYIQRTENGRSQSWGAFLLYGKTVYFRLETKWNGPLRWKFFRKFGIPSEVFLFSRFYWNDRKNHCTICFHVP